MNNMTDEQWVEEATIAYYESGAQYELDVDMEQWIDNWLEARGRLSDGSAMSNALG